MNRSLGYGTSSGGLSTGGNFRIRWQFSGNLQIFCNFLGGFGEKAYFCDRIKRLKGEDYGTDSNI